MGGNLIRVKKNNPTNLEVPANPKIHPNTSSELCFHSAMWPAAITAIKVHKPKMRLRRAKYLAPSLSGTSSEIAEDQATAAMLLAAVPMISMPMKTGSRHGPSEGSAQAMLQ